MMQPKVTRSYSGWVFVILTFTAISAVYLDFMRRYYPLAVDQFDLRRGNARIYLVLVHILLLLQLWSLFQVMLSHPGRVPPFWGFALTDSSTARRRYCLMCHVFKPERCHHCSVCNRCVLQMDHHCPWVNNCVGFYNRKFFVLLLWYTIALLGLDICLSSQYAYQAATGLMSGTHGLENAPNLVTVGFFTFQCGLGLLLLSFFKFHLTLVLTNRTTIEHIEITRTGQTYNEYDRGCWRNWTTTFGENPLMWLFPIYSSCGQPQGDGVRWSDVESLTSPSQTGRETPSTMKSPQHLLLSSKANADSSAGAHRPRRPENIRAKSEILDNSLHPEESELRDMNRALGSNSSALSQSFK